MHNKQLQRTKQSSFHSYA